MYRAPLTLSGIFKLVPRTRKVKARRQRERYQSGPVGQARRELDLQKQLLGEIEFGCSVLGRV